MIRGLVSFAFKNPAIAATRFPRLSLARIGCSVQPGARAKMFAASPVPCPTGSLLRSVPGTTVIGIATVIMLSDEERVTIKPSIRHRDAAMN
jgi:hypothetical protein